jgi:FRG domain
VVPCADWADFKIRWRGVLSESVNSDRLYNKFVFRGQSCSSWELTSSFDRKYNTLRGKERSDRYAIVLATFAKNLLAFAERDAAVLLGRSPSVADDSSELEALAQHHGLPTRLIDWSMSVYVAAFFAFSQVQKCRTGLVSVWALSTRFVEEEADKAHLELHKDFYPRNSRQLWQLGAFLRNKTQISDLSKIFESPQDFVRSAALRGPPALFRFDIPAAGEAAALDDLEMMRINSMSLFPGIEGVVRWLDREF